MRRKRKKDLTALTITRGTMNDCAICGADIETVQTHSTIPGVTEMIDDLIVCSRCFDDERGELY